MVRFDVNDSRFIALADDALYSVCTGRQLAFIVRLLDEHGLGPVDWYAVDLEAMARMPTNDLFLCQFSNNAEPELIGSSAKLIGHALNTNQFLRGVFGCVPRGTARQHVELTQTEQWTAELSPQVFIEIHMHDTTFIQIRIRDSRVQQVFTNACSTYSIGTWFKRSPRN